MDNLSEYTELISRIKRESKGSRKEQEEARRKKIRLIRELCSKYRVSKNEDFFNLILELFKDKIAAAVYTKFRLKQDKDEVISQIWSDIWSSAKMGVRKGSEFPLENEDIDQVAYINRIIRNVMAEHRDKITKVQEEPSRIIAAFPREELQRAEELRGHEPAEIPTRRFSEPAEGNMPMDKQFKRNRKALPDDSEEDDKEPDFKRKLEISPFLKEVFGEAIGGINESTPEEALSKGIREKATNLYFEFVKTIEDPFVRQILYLRDIENLRFEDIGERLFPALSSDDAETAVKNKYYFNKAKLIEAVRENEVIRKYL